MKYIVHAVETQDVSFEIEAESAEEAEQLVIEDERIYLRPEIWHTELQIVSVEPA